MMLLGKVAILNHQAIREHASHAVRTFLAAYLHPRQRAEMEVSK